MKLNPVTDLQTFANYRAPSATEGGSQTAFVFMNFALRRKLWGDKGSVTLRVADPFNLMAYGFRTADGRVIELNEQHFGQRAAIRLHVSNLRSSAQAPAAAAGRTPGCAPARATVVLPDVLSERSDRIDVDRNAVRRLIERRLQRRRHRAVLRRTTPPRARDCRSLRSSSSSFARLATATGNFAKSIA